MPPRAPYIDYEENNRMARVAKRVCLIHDHLMDAFRIKNGLDLDVGCRATPNPPCDGAKNLARQYKDKGHELPLEFFINKCIGAEIQKGDSPIDNKILDRMKEIYCGFAANEDLEIAPTNQYGSNQQLMARTKVPLKGSAVLKGLESICFPIPEKQNTPPKYAQAFNEDYCFVNEKGKGYIQLGPASLLNHHCDPATRNVDQFGADHKRKRVAGAIIFQPSLTRSVAAGEELCINYGDDWFGDNNRHCLCSKGHPRTTLFSSTSWSSVEHTDPNLDASDTPTTPRASRMKRRLTMSESDRPKIIPAPTTKSVKAKSTRSKEGTSSQRPHFKDDPSMKDLFVAPDDQETPFVPDNKRARRASNPSSSRPVITGRVKDVLSTGRESDIEPSSRVMVQPSKDVSLTSMATGQAKSTKKQDVGSSSLGMVRRVNNSSNNSSNSKSRDHTQTAANQNKPVETDNRKVAAPSSIQRSNSTSTAKHILDSISRPNKERPATSGQTIRSKAIQAYGTGKSSTSLLTKKDSVSTSHSARPVQKAKCHVNDQPLPPHPVSTTAPASRSSRPSLPTARLSLPTQSAKPQLPIQTVAPAELPAARRITPPTSPTTRALVGFIGPTVIALRASREAESIHEDTSIEETSLETLEGPEIMTPHIFHVDSPRDSAVARLVQLSPKPEREDSVDLGSESSYYDRSLYGPSSPLCLPGADPTETGQPTDRVQSVGGVQSANGGQSVNGGRSVNSGQSVNGGPSNFGTRSVCEDLDPDALDDEQFELLIYGERTEGRTEAEGDEMTPMEESSGAEPMDICSDDGDSGPTRNGGPARGDPVQQWRADVV